MQVKNIEIGQGVYFMRNNKVSIGIIRDIIRKEIIINGKEVLEAYEKIKDCTIESKQLIVVNLLWRENDINLNDRIATLSDVDITKLFMTKQELLDSL